METRRIVAAVVTVVFGWSMAMTAMGHAAALVTLAPVLGLTVQQVVQALRPPTAPASGHRVVPVPDAEDGAP
ncbi:hypothetical protein [Streptomyces rhizosphaericola]|uniref:MFS transporter n=1 Tax=Streptomyces rhizosphaericola TaxID=2564098 RepID=A0ABY2PH75_9ACTN|nr:hypothetical protein [Streptomyces rhizosphaericola]TGZ10257.1 hypothetical protein E5Z02_10820 [Streptomyces rhizosphaericola]